MAWLHLANICYDLHEIVVTINYAFLVNRGLFENLRNDPKKLKNWWKFSFLINVDFVSFFGWIFFLNDGNRSKLGSGQNKSHDHHPNQKNRPRTIQSLQLAPTIRRNYRNSSLQRCKQSRRVRFSVPRVLWDRWMRRSRWRWVKRKLPSWREDQVRSKREWQGHRSLPWQRSGAAEAILKASSFHDLQTTITLH